jgi:hypothetical protein
MEMRQRQTIVDQSLEIPKMLVEVIYFHQRTPLLRNRSGLTAEILDEYPC